MTVYTLIAYRPNGSYGYDRYDMEYSDSELYTFVFYSEEEIVNEILKFHIKSKEQDRSYKDWEIKILIDGRDEDSWTDEQTEEDERFWKITIAYSEVIKDWQSKEDEREEALRKAKETKKKEEARKLEAKKISQERALLKTLKEKYE